MKFVQVSDIHLGAPDALINGCSPTERLCACFKDINSWHSDAEFCVITGDLTDSTSLLSALSTAQPDEVYNLGLSLIHI